MPTELPIGIDLGTTHSLVAVFEDGGPRVLENELGESLVPSEVALDDRGFLVVGEPARERRRRGLPNTAARFKSSLGSDRRIALGSRRLSPTALSALVLRELRDHAAAALDQPVDRAVVSVPAWFGEVQRRETVEAAHLAGLEVLRLVNEPTAAALAYGLGVDPDPVTVAVVDLGGGTFDITVLELFDGVADVRASAGDTHLGGEDATDAVLAWAAQTTEVNAVGFATGPARAAAERTKRALSTQAEVPLELWDHELVLTRQIFATLTAELRTRMASRMRQAMVQANLLPAAVDRVLLVGGATRMPWIPDLARQVFGRDAETAQDVDRIVALGAAVQAGLVLDHGALREHLVTDVLTHSLGVGTQRSWGETTITDQFDAVLHRGATLPASGTSQYETLRPDQDTLVLPVYEGERRKASENHLLGVVTLTDLPTHTDEHARELCQVRFVHDASGLLEVAATLTSTGASVTVLFERGGVAIDDAERARVLASLASLRTHPRELLPNRWLLERSNRVLELFVGGRRDHLDTLITAFEVALNQSDTRLIEGRRIALRSALEDALDGTGLTWEDL